MQLFFCVLLIQLSAITVAFVSLPNSGITRSQSSLKSSVKSTLTPDDLIQLAKNYMASLPADRENLMADDYVFRGPVIGPLVKKDILVTVKGVSGDMKTAFPDMQQNAFGFSCDDPIEPMRVWYFVRPRGTFQGPFKTGTGKTVQPTGAKLIGPPEARSLLFNAEGKIKYESVGYITDRFTGDTTGGKGAVFGIYDVIGQPISAKVGGKYLGFLQKVTSLLPAGTVPISYSAKKDIPSWWTDKRRGNEA